MFCLVILLTVSVMDFQNSESGHIIPEHNPVGACGLVHALYDLKISVSEVEEVLIDGDAAGMSKP